MFETNYYSLVAGLREYTLDADTKGFDATEIVAEILEELSKSDARAVRLMYAYYDCENLIARKASRAAYNPLGNIAAEELDDELSSPKRVAEPMARVIRAYADPESEWAEGLDMTQSFEKALLAAYYEACSNANCRFLRDWAEFDRTLRNVSAAAVARSLGRPIDSVTVGGGEVVEQLQRSSAADFGLRGEVAYIDAVIAAVNDEQNLLEKEHKIDMVRWEQALELAGFDYFNINAILSYLARINIVARWSLLDAKRGREMLQRIMAELDGKDLVNKQ
ncbi:MAG: DUF2764 family protein [Rikenellaceae bacterium]|nr:DUF2764 family protein [Rikenellaceae bacterium]